MVGLDKKGEGDVVVSSCSPHEWTREWSFFIWTWTLTSWSDDCFVETVQRRFLGQEVVRTYSRTLWKVMVWAVIIAGAACITSMFALTYLVLQSTSLDASYSVAMGFACLLMVLGATALAYFTFVPPKECRSSRRA